MDELIPKITGHVRFLRSGLLVIIINQDENETQRVKPTALFNLAFLCRLFSGNAINKLLVPHNLIKDK